MPHAFTSTACWANAAAHFRLSNALMDATSADIATSVLSGKPSGKQLVRIAVADANFRTDAELADKGRFGGRWGGAGGRQTGINPSAVNRGGQCSRLSIAWSWKCSHYRHLQNGGVVMIKLIRHLKVRRLFAWSAIVLVVAWNVGVFVSSWDSSPIDVVVTDLIKFPAALWGILLSWPGWILLLVLLLFCIAMEGGVFFPTNRKAQGNPTPGMHQDEEDRPLTRLEDDKLGRSAFARGIAGSVSKPRRHRAMVVGLEGSWGSGKTCVINFTKQYLTSIPAAQRPRVFDFNPWLIGSHDQMAGALLKAISAELTALANEKPDMGAMALTIAEDLRQYERALAFLGDGADALGSGWVKKFIDMFKPAEPSLEERKQGVVKGLAALALPMVCIIDDLDRLTPAEIVEVMRLIRAVADFPYVTFLLAYDRDIVINAIAVVNGLTHDAKVAGQDTSAGITCRSGAASYLEKIVQVSIPLPQPAGGQLIGLFMEWAEEITIHLELGEAKREQILEDLQSLSQYIDPDWLQTPRVVRRVLAHARWTMAAHEGIYFADALFLSLTKINEPALYDWIADYLKWYAQRSAKGGFNQHRLTKNLASRLSTIFPEYRQNLGIMLRHVIPTIPSSASHENTQPFANEAQFAADKRLAHPDHYHSYFVGSPWGDVPHADDYQRLNNALATADFDTIVTLFAQWKQTLSHGGDDKFLIMVSRLSERVRQFRAGPGLLPHADNLLSFLLRRSHELMDEQEEADISLRAAAGDLVVTLFRSLDQGRGVAVLTACGDIGTERFRKYLQKVLHEHQIHPIDEELATLANRILTQFTSAPPVRQTEV